MFIESFSIRARSSWTPDTLPIPGFNGHALVKRREAEIGLENDDGMVVVP
jgi:hypothetical protein